jgi:hypothetical protein
VRHVRRLFILAAVSLLAVTVAAPVAYAWTPRVSSSGVPLPNGVYPGQSGYDSAGYYQYAPSIVQTTSTQRVIYYCANVVEYDRARGNAVAATHDHVLFNVTVDHRRRPDHRHRRAGLQPRRVRGRPTQRDQRRPAGQAPAFLQWT